jgi:chromosome segregation ATPase
MLNNLKQGGEAAMGNARTERVTLETVISGLHDELEATRAAAAEEAARLQAALDTCRAELHACNERLARTHATLGLTTERARVLESSRGQLQINLDGTLTTLEEATRRHAQEQAELKHARAAREAELLQTIHQAELRAKASEVKAEVALKRARRFEEELALARRAHLDEKLALTHELERFADRLAVVEGSRLDPTRIGNVAFAAQMRGRPSTASVPTTLLRGRYQRMVPPQMMASPAPA